MSESFLGGRVFLEAGDCRDVLAEMPSNMVHACVTDPPYHLTSIVKRFGKEGSAPARAFGNSNMHDKTFVNPNAKQYVRLTKGFMGKQWDGGDIAFQPELWAEVLRVLRPGGHLLAMGGTRTFHRLVCAIEDAGFEIRDTISWLYGSGFPKSHDVSRGIDRALGFEREKVRHGHPRNARVPGGGRDGAPGGTRPWLDRAMVSGFHDLDSDTPVSPEADRWHGWGTALKPAMELVCLARKPLSEGTVAANVLRWGCGAINVDGCRIDAGERQTSTGGMARKASPVYGTFARTEVQDVTTTLGRWPANLIHDGSDEVVAAFPETNGQIGGCNDPNGSFGYHGGAGGQSIPGVKDSGSAARFFKSCNGRDGESSADRRYTEEGSTNFAALPGARRDGVAASRLFYTSKADSDDRVGSKHPTVKPLDLIQYLCRLICPPGGTVLDPFAGTGTTGEAAWREGFEALLIEREPEYRTDIRRRMALALTGPEERARESIKARGRVLSPGPLFDGWPEAAE